MVEFVPYVSVTIAILFTLASLAAPTIFHHASLSIQAPIVIAAVAEDLHHAIDRLFPEELARFPQHRKRSWFSGLSGGSETTFSYALLHLRADICKPLTRLHLLKSQPITASLDASRPGRLSASCATAAVWGSEAPGDEVIAAIRGAFIIGRQRTTTQDVESAIEQLVEVTVRSLSPGINDPYTAITLSIG